MDNINNISPTLQSKLYLETIKDKNIEIFNFGLGENPVKQPVKYIELVKKYAHKKEYASCEGIPQLNNELKQIYNTKNTSYEILVGNGLKELLFIIQCAFKGKIIHITPAWVSYKEHIDILERIDDLIEIKTSVQDNFRINLQVLEEKLNKIERNSPKLMIINYPNNPTGTCYTNEELKALSIILRRHNCVVFADEIYLNISFRKDQKSISDYIPELTIRGSSVSKDLSCGGYRIGWCAFPSTLDSFFIKCRNYASRIYSCASVPIQYATSELLCDKELYYEYTNKLTTLFKHIYDTLNPLLKDSKLIYSHINGSWYIFVHFTNYKASLKKRNIINSIELSYYLMTNYQIITVAAQHFNCEELALRFSLVDFEFDIETDDINKINIENMKSGLKRLCNFLHELDQE